MAMNTMGKDGLTLISELINRSNTLNLKAGDFSITQVQPVTGKDYNTQAIIVAGAAWLGQSAVYYDRLDLNTIFAGLTPSLDITSGMTSIYDLLDAIADRYGVVVEKATVEETQIDRSNPDTAKVYLRFKTEHPAYFTSDPQGLLFVEIVRDIPLTRAVPNRSLDGIHYPDGDNGKGQASVYSHDWDGQVYVTRLTQYRQGDAADSKMLEIVNQLNTKITSASGRDWVLTANQTLDYNLDGASVSYNGPTSAATMYHANRQFANVVAVRLTDRCANFAGHLLFHYN